MAHHAHTHTRRSAAAIACAALASLAACGLGAKPSAAARSVGSGTHAAAFEPIELRIHPLTRLRNTDSGRSVDLYFELLDRFGHGVKSLGTLTVELRATGVGGQREPFQVRTWTVEMVDPAASSAAFDRVTRTYHVTLADVPTGDAGSSVRVRFRTGRGRDVTGTFALANPGPS
jgi:hypothetical protein